MIENVQTLVDNQVVERNARVGKELVHNYNVYHTLEEVSLRVYQRLGRWQVMKNYSDILHIIIRTGIARLETADMRAMAKSLIIFSWFILACFFWFSLVTFSLVYFVSFAAERALLTSWLFERREWACNWTRSAEIRTILTGVAAGSLDKHSRTQLYDVGWLVERDFSYTARSPQINSQ